MSCRACGNPISQTYYAVGNQVVCPSCHASLAAGAATGSRIGRLLRATIFGAAAGAVGTIIWFAIRKATGYEIGLVAIVVGVLVGGAVKKGSRGRGGVGYQLLAVFLTYSAIVANYVPDVFQSLSESAHEHRTQRAAASTQTAAASAGAATGSSTMAAGEEDDAAAADSVRQLSLVKKILLLIVFVVLLFAIAFIAPVLAGLQNIIGLLIIGFALWEAWKINKARQLNFTGPFSVNPQAAGGMTPPGAAP
jgi:hypothetical protein